MAAVKEKKSLGENKFFMYGIVLFIVATISAVSLTFLEQIRLDNMQDISEVYEEYLGTGLEVTEVNHTYDGMGSGEVLVTIESGSNIAYHAVGNAGRNGAVELLVNTEASSGYVLSIDVIAEGESNGFSDNVLAAMLGEMALGTKHFSYFAGHAQDGAMDTVSGATLTNNAFRNAFRSIYDMEVGY